MAAPSDAVFAEAVRAAERDLAAYEATREQFLSAAADLVQLACAWVEPYVENGQGAPPLSEETRSSFLRVNDARNELIGYEPSGGS